MNRYPGTSGLISLPAWSLFQGGNLQADSHLSTRHSPLLSLQLPCTGSGNAGGEQYTPCFGSRV